MRIIDDAGAKQALLDGAPYDVSVTVTPVGGTAVVIDGDHIAQNGVKINPSSVGGNKLELGTVICATGNFEFFNYDGTLTGIDFRGAELYVEGSVDVEGTATAFPVGYFIADTVKVTGSKISIQAFDRMILFDKVAQIDDDHILFPTSAFFIIMQSCGFCGVPLASITTESLPNYNVEISTPPSGTVTYRQLISWAAQILGRCLRINNKGQMEFVWYSSADWNVTPDNQFEGGETEKEPVTISGINVSQGGVSVYVAGSSDYAIDIIDNPLLMSIDYQTAINNVWSAMPALSYYPATFNIIHNVLAEPFDIVNLTEVDGTVKSVAVTDIVWDFSAKTTVQSKGASEETQSYAQQNAFTPQQSGQLSDASRLKIGRIESVDESIYFDLNTGEISTNNETERVTGSNSKATYETLLDFSGGALALVLKKDGKEIGRTVIGVNGLEITVDESQGISLPKPDTWDSMTIPAKALWWVTNNLVTSAFNMLNTVNNSITITNKDRSTYFQQSNLSSQILQILKAVADFTTGERIELSFDGLEVQKLTYTEGDVEPSVTQSEYKYDHASVRGTIAAATGIKVGSANYNDPAAKEVATQEYADSAAATAAQQVRATAEAAAQDAADAETAAQNAQGTAAAAQTAASNALSTANAASTAAAAAQSTADAAATPAQVSAAIAASEAKLADYIESTGTDGIWTWEKWHSGKAVCYGALPYTLEANAMANYGAIWIKTGYATFPTSLFIAAPNNVQRSIGNVDTTAANFYWVGRTYNSTATQTNFTICKYAQVTLTHVINIDILAVGRWK